MPVTCDATNGCTIDCKGDSCWAIYVHSTGKCLKGCGDDPASIPMVANSLNLTDPINVRVQGIAKNQIYQVLMTMMGRTPPTEMTDDTPITFSRDFTTPNAVYELLDFDNVGVPPDIEPPPLRRDNEPD
jgi:hypothetical protein